MHSSLYTQFKAEKQKSNRMHNAHIYIFIAVERVVSAQLTLHGAYSKSVYKEKANVIRDVLVFFSGSLHGGLVTFPIFFDSAVIAQGR